MNVRSLVSVATCGVVLAASCGIAQAGINNILYGYGYGMTYRAESPEGAYSYRSKKHDPCNPNAGRQGLFAGKSRSCPTDDGGYRQDAGGGNDYGDYYSPTPAGGMQGMPNGINPNLKPTPAPPAPGEREATPRPKSSRR